MKTLILAIILSSSSSFAQSQAAPPAFDVKAKLRDIDAWPDQSKCLNRFLNSNYNLLRMAAGYRIAEIDTHANIISGGSIVIGKFQKPDMSLEDLTYACNLWTNPPK